MKINKIKIDKIKINEIKISKIKISKIKINKIKINKMKINKTMGLAMMEAQLRVPSYPRCHITGGQFTFSLFSTRLMNVYGKFRSPSVPTSERIGIFQTQS